MWSMINTLQLIVRIPLITLKYPVNVEICYGLLVDMTNFSPFKMESLNKKLFNFSDSESYNDNFEALDIFWKLW